MEKAGFLKIYGISGILLLLIVPHSLAQGEYGVNCILIYEYLHSCVFTRFFIRKQNLTVYNWEITRIARRGENVPDGLPSNHHNNFKTKYWPLFKYFPNHFRNTNSFFKIKKIIKLVYYYFKNDKFCKTRQFPKY